MDIPPDLVSLSRYRASLGHKVKQNQFISNDISQKVRAEKLSSALQIANVCLFFCSLKLFPSSVPSLGISGPDLPPGGLGKVPWAYEKKVAYEK